MTWSCQIYFLSPSNNVLFQWQKVCWRSSFSRTAPSNRKLHHWTTFLFSHQDKSRLKSEESHWGTKERARDKRLRYCPSLRSITIIKVEGALTREILDDHLFYTQTKSYHWTKKRRDNMIFIQFDFHRLWYKACEHSVGDGSSSMLDERRRAVRDHHRRSPSPRHSPLPFFDAAKIEQVDRSVLIRETVPNRLPRARRSLQVTESVEVDVEMERLELNDRHHLNFLDRSLSVRPFHDECSEVKANIEREHCVWRLVEERSTVGENLLASVTLEWTTDHE